jgi:hypothetical protein
MEKGIAVDTESCLDFWNGQAVDRPLISFWIGTFSIPDLYPISMSRLPDGQLTPDDIDFNLFEEDYISLFEKNLGSCSDAPWGAFPLMTIPWVEAILGCPIIKKGNNIWAEPQDGELIQLLSMPFDLVENPWLDRLLDFIHWLVALSSDRFPVTASLMRGPSDLLSAMRTPSQMCLDLIDFPDIVAQILERLTGLWIQVANKQLENIPPYEDGYCFGQIFLWGHKKGAWFQDDAVALLSPKHYRQFLLPCEREIAAALPSSGIHLHPGSLYVVDDLVGIPDLDVIEINYESYGVTLEKMMPYLVKVTENKRLVLWGDFNVDDLAFLKNHLSPKNLCLQMNMADAETAKKMMDTVNEIWG